MNHGTKWYRLARTNGIGGCFPVMLTRCRRNVRMLTKRKKGSSDEKLPFTQIKLLYMSLWAGRADDDDFIIIGKGRST